MLAHLTPNHTFWGSSSLSGQGKVTAALVKEMTPKAISSSKKNWSRYVGQSVYLSLGWYVRPFPYNLPNRYELVVTPKIVVIEKVGCNDGKFKKTNAISKEKTHTRTN